MLLEGAMFSLDELTPFAVKEGRTDDAMAYAYAGMTTSRDKLIIRLYDALERPMKRNNEPIDRVCISLTHADDSYGYGDADGDVLVCTSDGKSEYIHVDAGKYNGMNLSFALKNLLVDTVKVIKK